MRKCWLKRRGLWGKTIISQYLKVRNVEKAIVLHYIVTKKKTVIIENKLCVNEFSLNIFIKKWKSSSLIHITLKSICLLTGWYQGEQNRHKTFFMKLIFSNGEFTCQSYIIINQSISAECLLCKNNYIISLLPPKIGCICTFVNSYHLWKCGLTSPYDREHYRIIMLEEHWKCGLRKFEIPFS